MIRPWMAAAAGGARVHILLCLAVLAALAGSARAAGADHPGTIWVVSRPPGAHVVLDGPMRVDGATPFAIDRGVFGVYQVTASLAGYRTTRSTVTLAPSAGDTITVRLDPLTRSGAFLRAVVFPGWGQRYLGRGTQAAVIFYGTAALGAAAVYEQSRYSSATDEYNRVRATYAAATETTAIQSAYAAMESQYHTVRDRRDRRNGFLWAGAAVWGAGVIDALVHPPEESHLVVSAAPQDGGTVSLALSRKF